MRSAAARLLASALVLVCAVIGAGTWGPSAGSLSRTEDRNHDGRPDVWRFYDARGRLVEIARDTNFDGRSDRQEYYDADGNLIRLEVDRNFDDRVDVVEEFDPSSHERLWSVVDVDFDGTADLLVLFQHGQPVFSTWAGLKPAHPAGGWSLAPKSTLGAAGVASEGVPGPLASMADPFDSDSAFHGPPAEPWTHLALVLSSTAKLPGTPAGGTPALEASTGYCPGPRATASRALAPSLTRGPPTFPL